MIFTVDFIVFCWDVFGKNIKTVYYVRIRLISAINFVVVNEICFEMQKKILVVADINVHT